MNPSVPKRDGGILERLSPIEISNEETSSSSESDRNRNVMLKDDIRFRLRPSSLSNIAEKRTTETLSSTESNLSRNNFPAQTSDPNLFENLAITQNCTSLEAVSPTIRRELMRRNSLVMDNSMLDETSETNDVVKAKDSLSKRIESLVKSPFNSKNTKSRSRHPGSGNPKVDAHARYKNNRPASIETLDAPIRVGRPNRVKLHIYDLIAKDTLVQFPSPLDCVCEIGKCFNDVNSALHQLGTGAYQ